MSAALTNESGTVNLKFKARIFEMLYSDRENLLELYNAVNETRYSNPRLLRINTLENAIYMAMKNDVSFVIDSRLSLYEHQSTYSPNLPLRYLMYVSDLYSEMIKNENIYGKKRILIPPPHFVIFYNGEEKQPDRQILKLSDLYSVPEKDTSLDLYAIMLNINPGHSQKLLNTCKSLRDYSEYTARVRRYTKELPLENAVERAITECIKEGILADFLMKNRAEAKKMSIYEYDEEKHIRMEREDAHEDGLKEGMKRGEENLLLKQIRAKKTKGQTDREIAEALETDIETVRRLSEKL